MMQCPACSGNNNGSCPTCHAHNYLVAPVEYNLVQQITGVMRSRLRARGEALNTNPVTTIDYWLKWAYIKGSQGEARSWSFVHVLAEKRAELATEAFRPMYRLADIQWDEENLPKECSPDYWIERAKKRATERVSCQTPELKITELMCVTDANNLLMEL